MNEKTIKILLVDDEPNIVELNQMYLETEGYEIVTAHNGLDALMQFRTTDPASWRYCTERSAPGGHNRRSYITVAGQRVRVALLSPQ